MKKLTVSSLTKATQGESTEELVLTDSETLDEVIQCLVENFSIETQGACDQQTLFEILVKAASTGDSIENTAKLLKNIPTANDGSSGFMGISTANSNQNPLGATVTALPCRQ